jgi:oligopeptide transport system substrate-binding protein
VTAGDFEFGIKRACNPAIGSYYSSVIAPQIRGCSAVLFADQVTPEMFDDIGVTAIDESILVIELEFPASYFLTMTPMWTLAATPAWAIDEFGEDWVEAGNIVTNGRYMLAEWVHNVRQVVLRNPLIPADLKGTGNIVRVLANLVPDWSTGYALWLNGEVEHSGIPDAQLSQHLEDYSDETVQVADLAVFYIAFRMTKPPFDDVHVRRALSAAFDRQLYIDTVLQGQGLPMKHFAPPGIFGAPPIDEVGVGFDPIFAKTELEAAGYPGCEEFPNVSLMTFPGAGSRSDVEFAIGQWQEHLGCDPNAFLIEQLPFAEMLAAIAASTPDEDAPHMWTIGWAPDYADENNWVGDVLWCRAQRGSKRTCNEIDEKIVAAREEADPARRVEMYREIEEAFFGSEGEFPFMPTYLRISYTAVHSWFEGTFAQFGGAQWYNYSIDQQAQLAARGK